MLKPFFSVLDFVDLMTYDLHGSWETFTGINAPLYARSDETGEQATLNVVSRLKLLFSCKYASKMLKLNVMKKLQAI